MALFSIVRNGKDSLGCCGAVKTFVVLNGKNFAIVVLNFPADSAFFLDGSRSNTLDIGIEWFGGKEI